MLKIIAYKNYSQKHTIVLDEGIVKSNLSEIIDIIKLNENLLIEYLKCFKFIVVKNNFDFTYMQAKKRYGWQNDENLSKFKIEYDNYYDKIDCLMDILTKNRIPFKSISTVDIDSKKIINLIKFIEE